MDINRWTAELGSMSKFYFDGSDGRRMNRQERAYLLIVTKKWEK
jgi:hypothetical protein